MYFLSFWIWLQVQETKRLPMLGQQELSENERIIAHPALSAKLVLAAQHTVFHWLK